MSLINQTYRLDLGQSFEGKYRILRELGRGGFGMVYLGYQEAMDRHVALKVLTPSGGADAHGARERFLREVKIISKLRHPNTVTIHDYGETSEGIVYMVLEYVEGDTLKAILRREGAQTPLRSLMLVRQIAKSLAEAHRHGVVHRDLKPANIMVMDLETETDYVKVLDFGVARLLGTNDADLTSAGLPEGERALIGTPRYMSPEQVRGENLTGASDLYSLGLILYELLVGEPAVQGDTTMGLISQQISPEPLRLASLPALHPRLQDLVRKATQKHIGGRHRSVEELADDIDHATLLLNQEKFGSGPVSVSPYFEGPGPAHARQSGQFEMPHQSRSGNWSMGYNTPNHVHHTQQPASSSGEYDTSPHQRALPHGPDPAGFGDSIIHSPGPRTVPSAAITAIPTEQPQLQQAQTRPVQHAPGGLPLMGYQDEYLSQESELGVPSGELPMLPSAEDNPFAVPKPEPEPELVANDYQPPRAKSVAHRPPGAGNFAVELFKVILLGAAALFTTYVAFLIVSTVLAQFFDDVLRLVGSIVITLAIPFLTALGENTQRERFHVVKRPLDRMVRICFGTALFSLLVGLVTTLALSGSVVYELRNNPNWFFRDSPAVAAEANDLTRANRAFSYGLADTIESSMTTVGLYRGHKPSGPRGSGTPVATPPPAPAATRPSGSNGSVAPATTSPPPTRPPTTTKQPVNKPREADPPKEESDYVRW